MEPPASEEPRPAKRLKIASTAGEENAGDLGGPRKSSEPSQSNNPEAKPTLSTLPELVYIRIFQLLDGDLDTATCLSLVHPRIYPFHLSTRDILAAKRREKAGLPPATTPPPRYKLIQSHLPVIRHIYWRGRYGRDDDIRPPIYGTDPVRCVKKPFEDGSALPVLLREFMGKVGLVYRPPYSLQFVTAHRFIELRNEWEMSEQACVALGTREQIEALPFHLQQCCYRGDLTWLEMFQATLDN